MDEPRTNHAPRSIAVLMILVMLYVASYLALVTPGAYVNTGPPNKPVDPAFLEQRNYRIGGDGNLVEQIYWPLEMIDRKMRPETWRHTYRKSRLFNPLGDRV